MKHPMTKEEVLDAFAIEPKHCKEVLADYVKRYPHLAEDLVDLSSERRRMDFERQYQCEWPSKPIPDPKLDETWREFKNAGTRKERI